MARICKSPVNSDDDRLWNRSSDDSLILEESNTSWSGSENEPATFQVTNDLPTSISLSGHCPNYSVESRGHCHRDNGDSWDSHLSLPIMNAVDLHSVYNASTEARLSLSGEDSEIPLLPSERHLAESSEYMRHCHSSSTASSSSAAWRRLMSASILCLFFMIAEVLGGLFAGSVAIMTDAAHLLSDLVGLLVSLSAVWLGQRPPTKALSFGFHRAEVLGALFSIFIIWVLTGIFVYIAILRLIHGNINIQADRMMAVAAGGIVINIIMGLVLHGGCHGFNVPHSHGIGQHQHMHEVLDGHNEANPQFSTCLGSTNVRDVEELSGDSVTLIERSHLRHKRSNINVRAAAIHVLGDLIQSIGVFIAAVVIKFNPDAKIADPICTFLFAIVVLATTIPLLRDTGLVLLEGFPRTIEYSQVCAILLGLPGVQHVHSLHVWSLTIGKHAISVHLAVDPSTDRDDVTSKARHILQRKYGINICTIQTESFDQTVMKSCLQCRPLSS